MKKTSLLGILALIASASALPAQFNPLPNPRPVTTTGTQVDGYAQLINEQGWAGQTNASGWGSSAVNPTGFDPFGIMNVVFIGESASSRNSLGIRWGDEAVAFGGRSTIAETETLFQTMEAPLSINSGHFVSINLDGRSAFDFWLNLEPSRSDPSPGIWSLFNPGLNPASGRINGAGMNQFVVGGESYYLFSFRGAEENSDDDTNSVSFFLHFSQSDDTPFTPVPEPSVYGVFGALLLTGLIARRRLHKGSVAR